ncbi:MAG: hypothetical protein ABIP94_03040 [Planctomycetota bacterium]
MLRMELDGARPEWWYRLSAWVRERCELCQPQPKLEGTLEELRDRLPPKWPVTQQLDRLLQIIEQDTNFYGEGVLVDCEVIAPQVFARDERDVRFLLQGLRQLGRIEPVTGGDPDTFCLTTDGLLRLEEISRSTVLNTQVFVAMWFDKSTDDLYAHGLEPAIREAGYVPFRVDRDKPHGERIDAKIMVDIRRSRALVADATGLRPSVFFEAGVADGLGKPVIWTVRKDHLKDLPFDTRQLLHVVWETPEQLAEDLRPVLENRLGIRLKLDG